VHHGFVAIEAEALRYITGSDLLDWQFLDSLIIILKSAIYAICGM
jgi:hypothetical protein